MAMNQSCYALVGKETHQLLVYFYTLKAIAFAIASFFATIITLPRLIKKPHEINSYN